MLNAVKNFSYPYKNTILISATIILIVPMFLLQVIIGIVGLEDSELIMKPMFLISSLLACLGFIYCTLGYHFQILKGDELKLRIHLESLNVALTTILVFLFILIFAFLNFAPTMLNYILVILSIVGIVAYLLAVEFIKEKYQ